MTLCVVSCCSGLACSAVPCGAVPCHAMPSVPSVAKKIPIKGVTTFQPCPANKPLLAAFIAETKGQPAVATVLDHSGDQPTTISRKSFYRATGACTAALVVGWSSTAGWLVTCESVCMWSRAVKVFSTDFHDWHVCLPAMERLYGLLHQARIGSLSGCHSEAHLSLWPGRCSVRACRKCQAIF